MNATSIELSSSFHERSLQSSVRAHEIRCRFARAALAGAAGNVEVANDLKSDVLDDAIALGRSDAMIGIHDAPMMFLGTALEQSWHHGVEMIIQQDIGHNCLSCQETPCDPCPIHG